MQSLFRAAMAGSLVGDVHAARYEHKKQAEIAKMIAESGGIALGDYVSPWKSDKGKIIRGDQPTDDSELTARYAYGLVRSKDFDSSLIYDQMRRFMIGREPMLANEAIGQGSTLKAALEPPSYVDSLLKFGRGEVPVVPSNGALMRNTPTYLRYRSEDDLVKYSRWQSCITHMHPLSQIACIAHSLVGSLIIDGMHPRTAWEMTKQVLSHKKYKKLPERDVILTLEPTEPKEEEMWPGGKDHTGHPILSLRIALCAAVHAKGYRDGISICIGVGGDTDTYAAIAGGLLGAHFGYESIPHEWLSNAQGLETMLKLADQLHELAPRASSAALRR